MAARKTLYTGLAFAAAALLLAAPGAVAQDIHQVAEQDNHQEIEQDAHGDAIDQLAEQENQQSIEQDASTVDDGDDDGDVTTSVVGFEGDTDQPHILSEDDEASFGEECEIVDGECVCPEPDDDEVTVGDELGDDETEFDEEADLGDQLDDDDDLNLGDEGLGVDVGADVGADAGADTDVDVGADVGVDTGLLGEDVDDEQVNDGTEGFEVVDATKGNVDDTTDDLADAEVDVGVGLGLGLGV